MHLESMADTAAFAHRLAVVIPPGAAVGLCGPLGAGKTTLTRSLVAALGGLDEVSSPTFVLEHEYRTTRALVIRHWDVYRLGEVPAELAEPPATSEIRLIEWADKFPEIVATCDLVIQLKLDVAHEPPRRSVEISGRLAPLLSTDKP